MNDSITPEEKKMLNEKWSKLFPEEKELFYKTLNQDGLYSVNIEWAILGMAMGSYGAGFVCSFEQIQPDHFYFEAHQDMWKEIVACCNDGADPDPVLLVKNLQKHESFNKTIEESKENPSEYVSKIVSYSQMDLSNGMARAKDYVDQLIEYATRRELVRSLFANFRMFRDIKKYPDTHSLISEMVSQVSDITAKTDKHRSHSLVEVSNSIVEDFNKPLPATPTGIARMDEAIEGGFFPGKTYCFAARPKTGKTMLMGSMFYNQSIIGHPVSYYAFEMGGKELHYRYLARFMGVNSSDFFRRRGDPQFQEMVKNAAAALDKLASANYINCPNMGFEDFKRSLVSKVRQQNPRGVYVDYLGKIKGPAYRHNRSEFEEQVADWMHGFAKESDIWIAYACQLNREGNLRGSDGALMAADMVYMLEKDAEVNVAWLKCIASRFTPPINIGSKASDPGLRINTQGPHFSCVTDAFRDTSDYHRFTQPRLNSELDYV